jgi:hypothetical protein
MKKLIAAMAAIAMLAAMSTTALAVSVPVADGSSATAPVLTTTTQTDTYAATIAWGNMTFAYDFGTWDPVTHTWLGETWVAGGFTGTKDYITVTNDSSQPITADFAYLANGVAGTNNAVKTTGTFTKVTGNLNVTTLGNDGPTGIMALALYPVGGPAPSGTTYLNLQGRPAAEIGNTAVTIGTITVTLTDSDTTGAIAQLAKVTDVAVTTVPLNTTNDKTNIEAAMLVLANAAVDTGYTVTIAEGSTYNTGTNAWAGEFTVTNDTTATNTRTDAGNRTITVVIATA